MVLSFVIWLSTTREIFLIVNSNPNHNYSLLGVATGTSIVGVLNCLNKALKMFPEIKRSEDPDYQMDVLPSGYWIEFPIRFMMLVYFGFFTTVTIISGFFKELPTWFFFLYVLTSVFALVGLYLSLCNIGPKKKTETKSATIFAT
jgi:hypothetical protein